MKKLLFVTASAVALAAAVPTLVAEGAAQPVDTKMQVADTSYPECEEDPLNGICDLFLCLTDPACQLKTN
ncbi:hypothetical protein I6F35_37525 [Bradyrhizobium sp. BRP22]|uniref:hypothetical protein n=1 Tax=Bradyrhizobium sp. BRP22 TaxID=2793821 RepID=UPI001CD7D346|nr:hypothetical protein [Bradyrhizobium sp. BRP22]MCA1458797.1 hypothetical protein [Bradyrhizobium sp. BRP22]